MSVINDLIEQIENPELRNRIQQEVNKLNKQRKFGLVFEEHVPEKTFLYDVPVKRGSFVAKRDVGAKDIYRVIKIEGENALCEHTVSHEQETIAVDALVAVAQLGEPIYPYLVRLDLQYLQSSRMEYKDFQSDKRITYRYFTNCVKLSNGPYENKKCVIRQGELITTAKK